MSKYSEAVKIMMERDDKTAWWEFTDLIDKTLCELKTTHPSMYNKVMEQMDKIVYQVNQEQAEKIVHMMKPYGQKWNYVQIKDFLKGKGVTDNCILWYLAMNMKYNDYHKTGEFAGMAEDAEFYYHLACDYIYDVDAEPFHVEKWALSKLV